MKRSAREGMTLVELTVGIAVLSVLGLVTAGLFKAGIKSYNYTINQVTVLSNARKALDGDGRSRGMIWESREADAVAELDPQALRLVSAAGLGASYTLSQQVLRRARLLDASDQAKGIVSMRLSYFSLDDEGRVVSSSAAAEAALVTAELELQGTGGKTFHFFDGAALRNR